MNDESTNEKLNFEQLKKMKFEVDPILLREEGLDYLLNKSYNPIGHLYSPITNFATNLNLYRYVLM